MNERVDLVQLRESLLDVAAASGTSQALGIVVSLLLAAAVVWLVYRRKLLEEHTPIWLVVSAALLLVSLRRDVLDTLARASGAWSYSSILFFLGELFLVAICLNFAVRLSSMAVQIRTLAQEATLLRARLGESERQLALRRAQSSDPGVGFQD